MRHRRHACQLCGKLVGKWANKHGPTGNHWECYWTPEMDEAWKIRRAYRPDPPPQPTGEILHAWANGGSLIHLVDYGSGVALCGHKPKRNAHRMKERGRWIWADPAKIRPYTRFCRKCQEKKP